MDSAYFLETEVIGTGPTPMIQRANCSANYVSSLSPTVRRCTVNRGYSRSTEFEREDLTGKKVEDNQFLLPNPANNSAFCYLFAYLATTPVLSSDMSRSASPFGIGRA